VTTSSARAKIAFVDDWRAIRKIVIRCRCTVTGLGPTGDGQWWAKVSCPSHQARVYLLLELGERDARDPRIRRRAENVVACAGAITNAERAAALQSHVSSVVRFTPELVEQFTPAWRTLQIGMGDCDDSARSLYALGRSLGLDVALQTLPEKLTRKDPFHVAAIFYLNGSWTWADASLPAELGEHPLRAAERIGAARW